MTGIVAGWSHTCALLSRGTVECWGYNGSGQLGDGTCTGPQTCNPSIPCSTTPVAVSGLNGATAIAAGAAHTCTVLSGGIVQCWGDNGDGQLGTNTSQCNGNSSSTTPVAVSGLSGATALAAGSFHTCALLSGGTVECWGYNAYGQLGDGATTSSMTPVAVSSLSGATAIAAGADHTCALLSDGTVKCWGYNVYGQLGNGTSTGPQTCGGIGCSSTPVAVSSLAGAIAISAGGNHTCAVLSGGSVECWGENFFGELGDGTSTGPQTCTSNNYGCSTTPVVVSGLSGATAVAAGFEHTCAVLSGGTAECWGNAWFGQLGNGTSTGPQTCGGVPCSTTPVAVMGLSGATLISAGREQTCAVLSGGTADCWGDNGYGELGDGTSTGPQTCSGTSACSTTPVAVSGL